MKIEDDYIPSAFLEPLLLYLEERKMNVPEFRSKLESLMTSPSLSTVHFCELLEEVYRIAPQPALGLRLGMATSPDQFGFIGYLLLSCSNLRQALTRYRRFQRLLHTGIKSWVYEKGNNLEMNWTQRIANTPLANEFSLAVFIRLYQCLIGKKIPPLRAGMPLAQSNNVYVYESILGCPVEFGADALFIEIPVRLMSMRIASSNSELRQQLEKEAVLQLEQSNISHGDTALFLKDLRANVIEGMKDGNISADFIAERMGYSTGSFYRKLRSSGHTYRAVLSDIRLYFARQYLQDQTLSHTEIALLLGYSEQSTFIRAFRSWTGDTPGEYRARLKNA